MIMGSFNRRDSEPYLDALRRNRLRTAASWPAGKDGQMLQVVLECTATDRWIPRQSLIELVVNRTSAPISKGNVEWFLSDLIKIGMLESRKVAPTPGAARNGRPPIAFRRTQDDPAPLWA